MNHWKVCVCGETNETEHAYNTQNSDEDNHWAECECGAQSGVTAHVYEDEWKSDENGHWQLCVCGDESEHAAHIPGPEATEDDPQLCTVCEYVIEPETGHIIHTPGDTLYHDDTHHWYVCIGCPDKLFVEEHQGGEATCTAKAVCADCGQAYGQTLEHNYSEEWSTDEYQHWYICLSCNVAKNAEAAHTFSENWNVEGNQHWRECETCGYKTDEGTHVYEGEWKKDDANHWKVCECGAVNKTEHAYNTQKSDENNHWNECECGAQSGVTAHVYEGEWKKDETNHWKVCECGAVNKTEHAYNTQNSDENNHWNECECGATADVTPHEYEGEWQKDDMNHWKVCVCGETSTAEAHEFETKHNETQHWTECACGAATAAEDHTWNEGVGTGAEFKDGKWVSIKCDVAGEVLYTCTAADCGVTKTETIAASGHVPKQINGYSATCEEPGLTVGMSCSKCGTVMVEQKPIEPKGHSEEIISITPATCTEAGVTLYKCKLPTCGKEWFEPIEAPGHTEETLAAVEPNCTETGLTAGVKCSVCNKVLVEQMVLKANGHSYSEEEADKVCITRTCTGCGEKVAPEAGHTFAAEVAEAVCAVRTCEVCGNEIKPEPEVGHDYDDGVVTKAPTHTEKGVKTFTCERKGCGDSYTEDVDVIPHEYSKVTTDPTCVDQGFTTYTCTCGHSYVADYVNATGKHTYGEWVTTKEATCTEVGSKYRECSVCYAKDEAVIALEEHQEEILAAVESTCTATGMTEGKICTVCKTVTVAQLPTARKPHTEKAYEANPATCTENGNEAGGSYCTVCNTQIKAPTIIYAKGHTEVIDKAVAPRCTTTGLTEGKHCSVCNEVLVAQTVLDATGHKNTKSYDEVDSTCTKTGLTAGVYCNDCLTWVTARTEIALKAHTEEKIEAVDPTCTTAGSTEGKKCSVCNVVLTAPQTLTAKGHTEAIDAAVEPTCTATGLTEGKHCSVCNAIIVAQKTVAAKGHTEVIDKAVASTCTQTGLTEGKHCSVCNEVLVAQTEIAAKGHTEVIDKAVAPKCTATGLTEGKHCSVCNEVLVAQTEVDATGHTEQIVAAVPATCTTTGLTEGTKCSVCGETLLAQTSVPAKGHTEVIDAAVAVTCTTDGLTEGKHCSVCNAVLVAQTVIGHKGHKEVIDVRVEATCTTDGKTEGKHCSACGEILLAQEVITKTGHTEVIDEGTPATCTATGISEGKHCSVCNEVLVKQEIIPAKGHTPEVVPAVAPTCTETGLTEGSVCSECDVVLVKQNEVAALDHAWNEGVEEPKHTCTTAGTMTYTCTREGCEATKTEEVFAAHTIVIDEAVAPTCTETGLTEGSHCSECDFVQVKQEIIPVAHTWKDVEILVQPTCTSTGSKSVICAVEGCGATETQTIDKLPHTVVIDPAVEETCTTNGKTEGSHCSVCNTILVAQETIEKHHVFDVAPCTQVPATCTREGCDLVVEELRKHDLTKATCTEYATCKYGCGYKDEAAGYAPHTEVIDEGYPAQCETNGLSDGAHCGVCGEILRAQLVKGAIGHDIVQHAAKKPTFTSVGWEAYEACSRCSKSTYVEIPALGEQTIESFEELVTYLPYLEEWAVEFAKKTPGTDPVDLMIKYIRTGVDRYNSGSWGIMAGYENPEFAKYVAQKEDEHNSKFDNVEEMIQVSGLKNLLEFDLPNGNHADLGHMFGTMDITYNNKGSVNHADVGGWAGDLVDLLSTADHPDHQDDINAVIKNGETVIVDGKEVKFDTRVEYMTHFFEPMVEFIRTKLLGFDTGHGDDFAKNDIWGDLDAFYIMQTLDADNYEAGDLTEIFKNYFISSLNDRQRADFLLANRLDDVTTRSAIREAVYNAYTTNSVISTLEGTREFVNLTDSESLITMRKAVCYAFADWLCIEAGDWVKDTDNPYLTDYEATYSLLAPGISMEIHKATSADGLNMVYYLGYADVGREDVHVMANYKTRNAEAWGMSRVMDQAYAAQAYHSNPDDPDTYIENFEPIIATNGAGFNMSTGEPSGLLVMNGTEYHMIDGQGFFGVTKDGRAVIGSKADYENQYKGQLAEGIAGFGTMLVKNGELAITATSNYYNDRASRTAVGITASGRVVLMVLDGRQIPWSCGGSMIEIAQIMKLAGCVTAVNLDGGGSTTFVARQAGDEELSVVNRPSDGVQRSVSTSLLIASTAPSSTAFDRAIIEADYNFLMEGATVNVKATGLSATNNIVDLPEGTYWTVSNTERATVTEDGVVTTNKDYVPVDENDNSFEVNLMLDGNVLATKTMTVVIPDMLYFDREKIDGIYGESTTLPLKARYEGKEVAFTVDDIAFTLEEPPKDEKPAGTMEGFDFVAVEESKIKTVKVTAKLVKNEKVDATITVVLYKKGENNFDFENATGGDRQLAWKREVTNSTYEKTNETYYIVDPDEPMVTSYTIALDMSQIPIPAKLESLTYMLPGADTPDASAWFFLLNLAQRISDMTEVTPKITIDPNFDVDYSELSIINEYFELTSKSFDEATNTLTLKLNWKRQTAAIDVATANPMCIVSGLKLTPKEGTAQKLTPVNKADISYIVYMRANALYTFANKPENQKTFDLYPYVDKREGTPYYGESGGYFSATYATFQDTYTLERSLKNGWLIEAGGFRYYVNNEYLVGIHKIDGLYYQFDQNGINVGQTPYSGLHTMKDDSPNVKPEEKDTLYTFYLKNGEKFKGWITLDDGNWYFFDWQNARGAHNTVEQDITDEEGFTLRVPYEFDNGRLLDGYWYRTAIGWRYYYGPYYYKQGWRQLNNKDGEPQMYFFEGYYVQKGVSPVQEAHATYEYWYEFTEGELAPGQLVGHAKEGLYWWDDDWYKGEAGTKTKELYYVKEKAEKEYSLAFTGGTALVDGDYYYFPKTGQAWRNKVDWINESAANGLLPAGNYRFGNDGKIDMSTSIDNENGKLYYYYNGRRTANAGIVEFEGEKYYIDSAATAVVGTSVWVSEAKTNGLVPGAGTYYFDEDGHLIKAAAVIKEGDNYYYYTDAGKRLANAGLVMFEGAYYHIGAGAMAAVDTEVNVTKTNGLLAAGTYRFDEEGKAILTTELVEENGKLNYYVNGRLQKDAGLIHFGDAYYFITADGSAVRGAEQEVTDAKANGLFPADTYEFAADGKMIIREGIHNGYYYVAGAKNAAGLVKVGEDYYYAAAGGKIVTDAKYAITKTNDLLDAGTYRFDEEGKINLATELADEEGKLFYYVNGRLAEDAGLVKIGEDYYYITEDGSAVTDAKYNVVKTNGLVPAGNYRFDADGKAIMDTYIENEDGNLAYYENGRQNPGAGLIKLGEDYYFIDNIGYALTSEKKPIVAGDILPEGTYRIGADGKFDLDTELVDEHGYLIYYLNGILTRNAGLIKMDGAYYYINENAQAVRSTKQDVQKTNNLLPAGIYRFGDDCKAILTTELVNEDGKLAYYKNGVLTKDAGLINMNAAYYYIDETGYAVADAEMLVEKTNGLLPSGTYRFDVDGKAILTTELVEEDGKLNYYVAGMLAKDAGLIKYEGDYYYITEDGSAAMSEKVAVTESKANGLFPADTYEFGADGKMVIYEGIVEGYYYVAGVKTEAGLIKIGEDYYYAGEGGKVAMSEKVAITEEKANGLFPADTYEFGADGKMVIYEGIVEGYYYVAGVKTEAGLVKIGEDYYYAGEGGKVAMSEKVAITEEKANGLFPADTYEFGADGKMVIYEGIVEGYYYVAGVKTEAGLVKIGEDYYYAAEGGKVVTDAKYDVTDTNDLLPAGTYRIDEEGKLILTTELVDEDGKLTYYENGKLTADAGLIKLGEDYYYITEDGTAAKNDMVAVTEEKANGLFPADTYEFGADGKMVIYDGIIVGGYYYEDGVKTEAGLVKIGEDYYYAAEGGKVVTDAKYDVTDTNDLLPAGIYRIDEEGKLILTTELVDEDGKLTYYVNGKLTADAGLIKVGEDYYYIGVDGVAVTACKVNVPENEWIDAGLYRFGADGKAILTTELANEDGKLVYYKNGKLTKDAGLVTLGGDYYYIDADGCAVTDTELDVEKTNNLLPAGIYRFDEDGKAILTTELVDEDGKLNYYVAGKLAEGAGLIKYEGAYYYITEDGSAVKGEKVAVTEEKANNLFPADTYEFGADGKMVIYDGVIINGHYYEDGVKTAAGLVKVDGDYYYAAEGGKIVTDAKYDVTKTNDLLEAGIYRIDEQGKLILTTELVSEDGKLTYYKDGKLTKDAGLIKDGEDYYYIGEDGTAVMNALVDVTEAKANGLFPADTYKFGPDGKMVIYDGVIVNGYYYEAGVKTEAGLVKIGEDYYYAAEGGKVVTDAKYDVTDTNDLLPEGIYRIDEEGKLILTTELVDEDGKLTYYMDGKLAEDAGLIKVGEDYYYIGEDGIAVTDTTMVVEKTNDLLPVDEYTFGEDGKLIFKSKRLAGDADEDGDVDIFDALMILQYDVGWDVEPNLENANVNGDDKADIFDALLILQYDVGWDVELI